MAREVFTVIYKLRIEQFDWSILTRHGRINNKVCVHIVNYNFITLYSSRNVPLL